MINEYGKCVECGKVRMIFYNDKCQSCYRKFGKKFKNSGRWEYKQDVELDKLTKTERGLCDLIVERQLSMNELGGEHGVGLNVQYMRIIRKKYLERVIPSEQ